MEVPALAPILLLFALFCCSVYAQRDEISVTVSKLKLAVVDSDTGNSDFETKLDSARWESTSLSANHLQKLKLSFKLTTPKGDLFLAHQAFLRLTIGSAERLFVFKRSSKGYELVLDFLRLVEELQYASGKYTLRLIVGDSRMSNSFLWNIGTLDLDLPEPPEAVAKALAAEEKKSASIFGPKPEISHIFRAPERRPLPALSYTFFTLTLLPFLGFLATLKFGLNVNLGNLPKSGVPLASAVTFHGGLAAILGLYTLFWLKLNLFTTLQYLGLLGLVTVVGGYGILSHLADVSSKVKTA